MSLPREPRQLMINIMYLVLTALLALNVSAEIFNAFEMVDGGLKSANASLDASNKAIPELIKEQSKKQASLATYADRIDGIQALSQQGSEYIDAIVDNLIDESGNKNGSVDDGDYVMIKDKKELRGKKNYDATTRLMVDDGKGMELKEKMLEMRAEFLKFVDEADQATMDKTIPIHIDEDAWKNSPNKKKDWADFNFGHMPVGATMPIFSKFKNDIKASESELLNYLAGKVGVGGQTVVLDKYTVVSAPKKSYIIKGERFETDVFLSASAGTDSQTGLAISVNGRSLRPDKDGVAKYTETASTVGQRKFNAAITITDPVTGETQTFKKQFEYEVGERSVAISPSKMNVFYIGVDNPVEISAAGVSSSKITVSMTGGGGKISKNADGTYKVNVSQPTKKGTYAKINVTADGMNVSKDFRVKRIPDPVPMLGKKRGGKMSAGELKIMPGVFPALPGFDFDAKCNISGYRVVRVAKRSDPIIKSNKGGKFTREVKAVIAKARPGDKFYFEEIRCKCPGDKFQRDLGTLGLTIK